MTIGQIACELQKASLSSPDGEGFAGLRNRCDFVPAGLWSIFQSSRCLLNGGADCAYNKMLEFWGAWQGLRTGGRGEDSSGLVPFQERPTSDFILQGVQLVHDLRAFLGRLPQDASVQLTALTEIAEDLLAARASAEFGMIVTRAA